MPLNSFPHDRERRENRLLYFILIQKFYYVPVFVKTGQNT